MQDVWGAGTPVRVEVVDSLEGLARHADAWDALALETPERIAQTTYPWVSSYLEHGNPSGRPWYCLFAYRGEALVGVLPVLRKRRWGRASLLCPEDDHTDVGHPVLAPRVAAEALDALLGALEELQPGRWVRCFRVRETAPLLSALNGVRKRRLVHFPVVAAGRFVDTTGPFEVFEKQLSSSFRRSLRGARRKAEAEHSVHFEVVTGQEAARADLFEDFLRVEASGWKGEAGTAIACDPADVAFYTTLTRRLAARGWLEWNLLRFDGVVVAAHLGVRLGSSLLLPKGGYDESLARFAPGNVLFWEVFSRAFADDTVEVNFLTEMPWMQIWHMEQSMYHDVVIGPRTGIASVTSRFEAAEPRRRLGELAERHPRVDTALRRLREAL